MFSRHAKTIIIPAIFILLILFQSPAYSWDWDTHRYIAQKVCEMENCPCMDEIIEGSTVPDRIFKDYQNHYCYNTSFNCTGSIYWTCPKRDICPAMESMYIWLENSKIYENCTRWYNIGIALHYYSDSLVFWHRVKKENYYKCHSPFEEDTGNRLVDENSIINRILSYLGLKKEWVVCRCNVCTKKADIIQIINSFSEIIKK